MSMQYSHSLQLEYKDIIFLRDYLSEQAQALDKKVKESYMDEKPPLDEISSLGKTRDDLTKIIAIIKTQI